MMQLPEHPSIIHHSTDFGRPPKSKSQRIGRSFVIKIYLVYIFPSIFMFSLFIPHVRKVLKSLRNFNRVTMHFQKWLQYMNLKKEHSLLGLIPHSMCIPINVPDYSKKISQYDVEENIGHLMTLARIALEKGESEKAVAILEMGLKICEEYQSYYVMPYMYDVLVSIAFAMGDLGKAEVLLVQIIEKMLQLGTSDTDTLIVDFKLRLSRIYSSTNDLHLAELGFKTCLNQQEMKIMQGDTSPQTGMLYINTMFWYGLHKIKQHDYKLAKKLINSAYSYSLKIKGLSPYQEMIILCTLADLNVQLEEYDVALQNLQSAILLGKGIGSLDLPTCYVKLAKIYMKLNSIETARKWVNEARSMAELFNDKIVLQEADTIIKEIGK